jgi:hypothetical protein
MKNKGKMPASAPEMPFQVDLISRGAGMKGKIQSIGDYLFTPSASRRAAMKGASLTTAA